jgi:hypothetical protein
MFFNVKVVGIVFSIRNETIMVPFGRLGQGVAGSSKPDNAETRCGLTSMFTN